MRQRRFILRKNDCNGALNIIRTKSVGIPRKDYGRFISPNRDTMKLGMELNSLEDMDEIEIKIIKRAMRKEETGCSSNYQRISPAPVENN